ncbi:uncharacterized protein IL334_003556 [Kwoniella shivajii]|uniref:Uncharacterized protein n=1 Tax=Kwoniella shivajii TaxID=564305 RepID=A0ABZ1D1Z3_9TREE|nr:hypothetical protein IL334_003556 [Kwoniella shivajii]
MRITRLSRIPLIPSSSTEVHLNSASIHPSDSISRRTTHRLVIVSTCLLPIFLSIALALTLLPLLLPSIKSQSLNFFSISPVGYERLNFGNSLNITTNGATTIPPGKRRDEHDESRRVVEGIADIVEGVNTTSWKGVDGPSIFVGALQICSKTNASEVINCTSSSQAVDQASLIPEILRSTLLSLPLSPSVPILLLVSGILSLLAFVILVAGLVQWQISYPFISLHSQRRGIREDVQNWAKSPYSFSESTDNLVSSNSNSHERKTSIERGRPHVAFFGLIFAALGLSLGAMIQWKVVFDAYAVWRQDEAQKVGLEFRFGLLTWLLPILPICLICILVIAASAPIYTFLKETFQQCPADRGFLPEADGPVVGVSPPDGGEVGKGREETPIINPPPAHISISERR